MSWDQGVQVREGLPAKFVAWADAQAKARGIPGSLEYITWFESDRSVVHLDFGGARSLKLTIPNDKAA